MSAPIRELSWPGKRLGEALTELARRGGLGVRGTENARPSSVEGVAEELRWATLAAAELGVEAELVGCSHRELETMLASIGPALLPLPGEDADAPVRYLVFLPGGGSRPKLLGPDGAVHRRSAEAVTHALSGRLYQNLEKRGLVDLLAEAGVRESRRARVLRGIASERYAEAPMGPFLTLRPHPSSSLWVQAKHAGIIPTALTLVVAHALSVSALLVAWYLVGRGALSGQLDIGWLVAWALALGTTVPLSAATSWAQGRFAITAGRLMKQRLLYGALRLKPDAMRLEGAGSLLGKVLESTAVESLVLGGSLAAALSLIDLVFAGWVLFHGAGGWLSALALAGYAVLAAVLVRAFYARIREWTDQRLEMTHDLVERMVGHRTRLAQESRARWHEDEDAMVDAYLGRSEALDRKALFVVLLPRGWLVVGALAMAPAFIAGADTVAIAIAIGGLLLGFRALGAFSGGLGRLARAAVAWRQVKPLFDAGEVHEPTGEIEARLGSGTPDPDRAVVEARDLVYRYAGRERAVLRECSLSLSPGDQVLVEGASGSGKSTLATVLGGLREPSAGLLLVDGLDAKSLGAEGWRAKVTTVPQFHENHVFSASFAFNALMGRSWPPGPGDLDELREVCEELGLGPLLERMPAGFEQSVGDQGWQLSHGERSRLFLARAIVQKDTRVWIFDESFAALDPITLERCVRAVQRRAPCLVVVAHP